ncbi:WD40 repeat-like protein [Mollisia scopiformis]|uniref:WD40 repeat-like protein n=1 Tax=Mollisia scopiformis TaxID=149040 RepID=A0A132BD38_MOLSC|nr:WD40 repeat-like protein [Mollisia scopiformis]KUJ10298.1 WD40 repeat-like protein [Mollisia scopiformis]
MSPMMEDDPIDADQDGFMLLQHGHRDMVEAVAFNSYGDRFASGSVDGKIKVYNRHRDMSWNLCDTWGAHTAEILQIQWLPTAIHPSLLASIGTDGKFKLWVEDPTLSPQKGRRFNSHSSKPVFELRSPSRSPFLSFSISHNPETHHTYLALINRSGVLVVWENEFAENLESWTEVDSVNVCEKPGRGEETSFRVQFDPSLEPCYTALRHGVPRDALGIVVASMDRASIWRTKEVSHNVSLGHSSSKELYLAAELKGHRGLVRDVAWASGSMRGFDVVATACKDGFVRVFQVAATEGKGRRSRSRVAERDVSPRRREENGGQRNVPSGIGAGLAGARQRPEEGVREGEVMHVAKEVSKLDNNKMPVWRLHFDADGQMLASVGDDGKLLMWRREPNDLNKRISSQESPPGSMDNLPHYPAR